MRHVALISIISTLFMSGCVTAPPVYKAPPPSANLAAMQFEYISPYPISVGQVFINSAMQCGVVPSDSQLLFRRARGNPLLTDENSEGVTYIPAGKSIGMRGAALPGTKRICRVDANFTPRAGTSYFVVLTDLGNETCQFAVVEGSKSGSVSKDFIALSCPP